MNKQKGYIDIPGWWFWMVPVGVILLVLNGLQVLYWLLQHVNISFN